MEPRALAPARLSPALESNLRRTNPWWEGRQGRLLPPTRRHLVGQMRRRLDLNLAPIVAVRGPRQIGKTTSQEQLLDDLLAEGLPPRQILRVQVDEIGSLRELGKEPILRFVDWYESEILGQTLNEAAHAGAKTYLFFDEIQNLSGWAPQLKFLVDHSTTQVVVTGSSALRIEQGRDSLAGRLTTINAGVLSLTEIGMLRGIDLGTPFLPDNGLEPLLHKEFWEGLRAHGRKLGPARDRAFAAFSERGGYPLMHARPDASWAEMADQLNEAVIERIKLHERVPLAPEALKRHEDLSTEAENLARIVVRELLRTLSVLDVLRFPLRGREPEVDFVLTIGSLRIPVAVKYQWNLNPARDTTGLCTFLAEPANHAPFGLLITRKDDDLDYGQGIVALPLASFLLLR